jgi:hypothetical protein
MGPISALNDPPPFRGSFNWGGSLNLGEPSIAGGGGFSSYFLLQNVTLIHYFMFFHSLFLRLLRYISKKRKIHDAIYILFILKELY